MPLFVGALGAGVAALCTKAGAAIGGSALVLGAKGATAGAVVGSVIKTGLVAGGALWGVNRYVDHRVERATGGGYGTPAPSGSGGGGYGTPAPSGSGGGVNENVDVATLRYNADAFYEEAINVDRALFASIDILAGMTPVLGGSGSDMGSQISQVAQKVDLLAAECSLDMGMLYQFMTDRIAEAQAGNQATAADLQGVSGSLSGISFS